MDEKIMFFKVFQNRESMFDGSRFFVETLEKVFEMLPDWVDDCYLNEVNFPILEPVLMTQAEFDNLPEFEGY